MSRTRSEPETSPLKYSADGVPPAGLSWLLAAQTVALIIAGIVLTPAIVLRGAEMPATLEAGVIFFALMVCGVTTIIQARRVWRFGAGYILLMGTSGAFIAVADLSFRVLGGMVDELQHYRYFGLDFINLKFDPRRPPARPTAEVL